MHTPPPLRVVHLAGTADGAPWLIAFLREQKALGYDVSAVLSGGDGTIAPILDRHGIAWRAADQNLFGAVTSPVRAWRTIWKLARLLRSLRPDIVHLHLFPTVMSGRMAAWLADVPVRISMNCGPYHLQSPILRDIEAELAWMDTRTVASCELTRALMIRQGVPREQVELIYYAVDQSAFDPSSADGDRVRRELGIAAGEPVIGQIAHFYQPSTDPRVTPPGIVGRGVKGHDVILRAVPLVLEEIPRAKFVFCGKGWGPGGTAHEREMHALARELGIADSVIFTGERTDVPDVLASFDVALQCSLNENLGGSVEALLMARPTVASNVGGLPDTVVHEKTGLLVPPDDPPALAAAIVRLLHAPDLARRLGESGRAFMLDRFTLARSVADLDALYRQEAARHRRGHRLLTMLVRAALLPFRVGPLALRVGLRLTRGSNTARAIALAIPRAISRLGHRLLKRKSTAPSHTTLRIAQVAATSRHSPWFVEICTELAQRGYDVCAVIDSSPGDLAERLTRAGIRVHALPLVLADRLDRGRLPLYILQLPLTALRLAWILRRERIDIAQSHIFVANVVTRLARVLTPIRHIATIVGPRHLEAPLTRAVDRRTWWLDDFTVAGCRHTLDLYRRLGAREERLECVYYGTRQESFDPSVVDGRAIRGELGIDAEAPVVGLIAYFYPPTSGPQTPPHMRGAGVKGHEHFLAAARIVAQRFPSARFVLAGDGANARGEEYRSALVRQCREDAILRDRVVFAGNRPDVPALLATFDVAVQCSLTENLGGTIEALLMERPIVATSVGGMPESVRHEETGLLVPPADPASLAAAIERLLGDREEAARLGRAGRALMLQRFTLSRTADDLEALFARCMRDAAQTANEGARP